MRKRIWTVRRRGRRPRREQEPAPEERESGEEAVLTREQESAEATPSGMTRLKTDRL